MFLIIINSIIFISFATVIFLIYQLVRLLWLRVQLIGMKYNSRDLSTFKGKHLTFWSIWIWDARRLATADTFLDRL